jgi:hypothetical protein
MRRARCQPRLTMRTGLTNPIYPLGGKGRPKINLRYNQKVTGFLTLVHFDPSG